MRVTEVRVRYENRPHAANPIRDALQTLTGGGSVHVEIVTDDGLVGASSTSFGRGDGAPRTLAVLIETELAPVVIGQDAAEIGAIVEAMKAQTEYYGTFGLATFGISAIDVALWDLVGKAHGVPTYQLWAPYRDRVPAYAMVGWSNYALDELKQVSAKAVEEGFRGVKLKVGASTLDEDVSRISAVQAEVGDGVRVMVDANQVLTLDDAVLYASVFADLGVYWFEEPIRADDLRGYAELKERSLTPIATGENLYSARAFRELFEQRGVDIVQPDLRRAGGPTEIRAVGALAGAYGIPYASHGGGPAALSLLTSVPTASWLETGLRSSERAFPLLEDGNALAPTGAGFAWE